MRIRTIQVAPDWAGRTVESLLKGELELSGALTARLKRRENGICLNGQRVYTNARVAGGDVLSVQAGDWPVRRPLPMACPLSVLWEDEDILILDKPAGLAVHASTRTPGELTLEMCIRDSGNKERKQAYLLADALAQGCDTVLTTGGAQSNHAMLTAACCNRLGLSCILVLKKWGVWEKKGNQLLDDLLGADVRFVDTDSYGDVYAEMDRICRRCV